MEKETQSRRITQGQHKSNKPCEEITTCLYLPVASTQNTTWHDISTFLHGFITAGIIHREQSPPPSPPTHWYEYNNEWWLISALQQWIISILNFMHCKILLKTAREFTLHLVVKNGNCNTRTNKLRAGITLPREGGCNMFLHYIGVAWKLSYALFEPKVLRAPSSANVAPTLLDKHL